MRRVLSALMVAFVAACASGPADSPPPPRAQAPVTQSSVTAPQRSTVKVIASALNVRSGPSAEAEVVGKVSRGDELIVIAANGGWTNVQLASGATGWVSSQHVSPDGLLRVAPARTAKPQPKRPARAGCPADAEFAFTKAPVPSFEEVRRPGLVVVDAQVDAKGNVMSTRIVSNSTGDAALGTLAEREIKTAKFSPPIRNCRPQAFIFSYKRSF